MKKIIILYLIIILSLLGCKNNSTQPATFRVGDIIGRWQNSNGDKNDYFLITTDGYLQIEQERIPIRNWYPYEEVTENKIIAQMQNNHFITFLFVNSSSCKISTTDGQSANYYKL